MVSCTLHAHRDKNNKIIVVSRLFWELDVVVLFLSSELLLLPRPISLLCGLLNQLWFVIKPVLSDPIVSESQRVEGTFSVDILKYVKSNNTNITVLCRHRRFHALLYRE